MRAGKSPGCQGCSELPPDHRGERPPGDGGGFLPEKGRSFWPEIYGGGRESALSLRGGLRMMRQGELLPGAGRTEGEARPARMRPDQGRPLPYREMQGEGHVRKEK